MIVCRFVSYISRHKMTDKVSTVTSWIFCLI